MRNSLRFLTLACGVALLAVGCAGPEQKLGRGFTNLGEFGRMGEINRSMEQATLYDGSEFAPTTGLIVGVNRSFRRTALGVYEIVTFPFPNRRLGDYGPVLKPVSPVYPDTYRPGIFADSINSTDSMLGFSGGDIAPMISGSRFRIFDN